MEVGVLNLQIHDNSAKAAEGLGRLATALGRVKSSVDGLKSMGRIASAIEKITTAVNSTTGFTKFANGLEKTCKAINSVEGAGRVANAIAKIAGAVDSAKGMTSLGTGIERMQKSLEKITENGTITNMNAFADALKRINEAGKGLQIPNIKFYTKSGKTDIEEKMGSGGTDENGFREVKSRIEESEEAVRTAKGKAKEIADEANERVKQFGKDIYQQFADRVQAAKDAVASANKTFVRDPVLDLEVGKKGLKAVWETYKDTSMAEQVKWQFADMFAKMNEEAAGTAGEFREVSAAVNEAADSASFAASGFKEVSSEVQETGEETEEAKSAMERFKEAMFGASEGSETLRDRLGNLFPRLAQLAKQFERIAMRRSLMWVLKQITAGVKEGVENFKAYSEQIGTAFAPSLDSLASSLQVMRNAIGAALAPVIQALIPVVQSLVNAFIDLVNWVNQFFSLLSGKSTWSKAIPAVNSSVDKVAKSAGKAAKEIKGLLADWDELNIIQSENNGNGGSGGVGKQAEQYETMFTEVNEFAAGLKELVNQINEKFGSIWGLVARIGAAILAWKVSTEFGSIVGMLAGMVGAGIAMDLVFRITEIFDNMYFNTGDEAWLIGSLLTPLIGGMFAKQILKNVAGGLVGEIMIPLAFIISAAADIKANVQNTDISALSQTSLMMDLVAALKGSVAAGYLAYTLFGHSWGAALAGGAVGLLATFGVAVGLKADIGTVDAGEITKENVTAKIISVLSLASAGALLGAKVGGTAAAAAGMGMLFGGLPIITAGVSVGIAAINQVVSARLITKDVIEKNLIAGGLIGAGLEIVALATGGALITGPLGAALTIGALFVIEAMIANTPQSVFWGGYEATREEIEAVVTNKVFKVNPKIEMDILNDSVSLTEESKSSLQLTVDQVNLTVKKIKLGYQENDILNDLHNQIFGTEEDQSNSLMGKFKAAAKAQENTVETAITLLFTPGQNKDGTAKKLIDEDSASWKILNEGMDLLGRQLSESLQKAYSEKIGSAAREMELETITELTDMMTNIAAAMASGEAMAKAQTAMLANLGNLSKESFIGLADYINEYKQSIIDAKTAEYDAMLAGKGSKVAGLREEMNAMKILLDKGKITQEQYQIYEDAYNAAKADYEAFRNGRNAAIKEFVNATIDEDMIKLIRDNVLPMIAPGLENMEGLMDQVIPNKEILKLLFNPDNTRTEGAGELLENYITESLKVVFGDNYEAIRAGIEAGIFKYSDFFSQELIDTFADRLNMNDEMEYEFKSMIAELFGWDPPVKEIKSEASEAAQEAVDAVTEGAAEVVEENKPDIEKWYEDLRNDVEKTFNPDNAKPVNVAGDPFFDWVRNLFGTTTDAVKGKDVSKFWMDLLFGGEGTELFTEEFMYNYIREKFGATKVDFVSAVAQLFNEENYLDKFSNNRRSRTAMMDQLLEDALALMYGNNWWYIKDKIDEGTAKYSDFITQEMIQSLVRYIGRQGYGKQDLMEIYSDLIEQLKLDSDDNFDPLEPEVEVKPDFEIAEPENNLLEDFLNFFFSAGYGEEAGAGDNGPVIWTLPEDVQKKLDDTKTVIEGATFPAVQGIDTSAATQAVGDMTNAIVEDVNTSIEALNLLSGYVMGSGSNYAKYPMSSGGSGKANYITQRASGGFIRSGDLVMANENGMIEMMGTMGNKPVVANNQQIVDGIQKGVRSANEGQNELLRAQNELLRRILDKTGSMSVSPSASWGEFQQKSAELWARQTGR